MHRLSPLILATFCLGPGLPAGAAPRSFLPDPGPARVELDAEGFTLGNDALSVAWTTRSDALRPRHLVDRYADEQVPWPGEAFQLIFRDGRNLEASAMRIVEAPRRRRLDARPTASRLAERLPGESIVVELADPQGEVEATWTAMLRDGANYVRVELVLSAGDESADIARVILLDQPLPGVRVAGSVSGSPIVFGDRFLGLEHPMAEAEVTDGRARAWLERALPLRGGQSVGYAAIVGVAPDGQLRRGVLHYVEHARAHPYRPFLHYNSWYDIGYFTPYDERDALDAIRAYGRELAERRGVDMDSFLFDDGWDDTSTVWEFHQGFPRGFVPLKEAAARYGAGVGVWLSPWGGYGAPREARLATGAAAGYEIDEEGYALSGPRYYTRFHDVTEELLTRYGVNQFKLDGTGSPDKTTPGSDFDSDFAAAIQLIEDLRGIRPDLYVNLTTGTWPSPFWLRHADSIWRGGWDHEFGGVGSDRQRWITYRDADTYAGVVRRGPLFPLNSLMLHGLIYARHARGLATDPHGDLRDEIRSYFAAGTQLQELYVTPALLSERNWDDLAAAAKWARANADTLVDSHWVGGDPAQLEVYGWASWSPAKGILALRNPADRPQAFAVELVRLFELPDGAPRRFRLTPVWEERNGLPRELGARQSAVLVLAPFEVLVLEATPVSRAGRLAGGWRGNPAGRTEGRPEPEGRPHRVACLGERAGGWCTSLHELLGGESTVRDLTRKSATIADLLTDTSWRRELRSFAPRQVAVLLGPGDAGQERESSARRGFVRRLRRLLVELAAEASVSDVVLLAPDSRLVDPSDPRRPALETELRPLAIQTAREAGARVADLAFLPNLPKAPDERPRRIAEATWLALTDGTMGKAAWKAVRADDEAGGDASDAVDGDPATFWATRSWRGAGRHPHELIVDLGEPRRFGAVVLLPRQDGSATGRIRQLELFAGTDGRTWGEPIYSGSLADTHRAARLDLGAPVTARFLRLVAHSEVTGGPAASLAELDILPAPDRRRTARRQ